MHGYCFGDFPGLGVVHHQILPVVHDHVVVLAVTQQQGAVHIMPQSARLHTNMVLHGLPLLLRLLSLHLGMHLYYPILFLF